MVPVKKCLVCLSSVKERIKLAPRHSLEEQLLVFFLLRKLMWTPTSDEHLKSYLKTGNPSDWAVLCHICEKLVRDAFNMHRQVMGLVQRISDIRRKLYTENFYEDDTEEEVRQAGDDEETHKVFMKLRRTFKSDHRLQSRPRPRCTVFLKYAVADSPAPKLSQTHDSNNALLGNVNVKSEPISDEENHFSDAFEEIDVKYPVNDDSASGQDSADLPWKEELRKRRQKNFKTKKRKLLVRHQRQKAQEVIPGNTTKCSLCTKVFRNRSCFQRHCKTAHSTKDFKCPSCGQRFARKDYLLYHLRAMHPEEKFDIVEAGNVCPLEFQCLYCPRKFNIDMALRRHVRKTHPNEREVYGCDKCERRFEKKDALKRHIKFDHGSGSGISGETVDRKCQLCNRIFHTRGNLRRHLIEVHKIQHPQDSKSIEKQSQANDDGDDAMNKDSSGSNWENSAHEPSSYNNEIDANER